MPGNARGKSDKSGHFAKGPHKSGHLIAAGAPHRSRRTTNIAAANGAPSLQNIFPRNVRKPVSIGCAAVTQAFTTGGQPARLWLVRYCSAHLPPRSQIPRGLRTSAQRCLALLLPRTSSCMTVQRKDKESATRLKGRGRNQEISEKSGAPTRSPNETRWSRATFEPLVSGTGTSVPSPA